MLAVAIAFAGVVGGVSWAFTGALGAPQPWPGFVGASAFVAVAWAHFQNTPPHRRA